MSFTVAVQSAVFYLLACTPCTNARQHHRTRARANKERAEKQGIITEQPDLYRHPSPYNTNPYWAEEIRNGPTPSGKYSAKPSSCGYPGGSRKDSIVSDLPAISLDSRSTIVASPILLDGTQNPTNTAVGDGGAWQQQQQQGRDASFGHRPVQKLVNVISKARSSAGRFVENTLGLPPVSQEDRHNFYSSHHKNPPVNDLHPPIVSTKAPHPVAHKWMLEPPPPARVMEGRVPMRRRSLNASKAPRATPTTDDPPPFDRLLLVKHLEESARLARGPTEEELINELIGLPMPVMTLTRRSRSFSLESSSSSAPYSDSECASRPSRPSHAPSSWTLATSPSSSNGGLGDEKPSLASPRSRESLTGRPLDAPMHAAQRPKLQTIISSRIGSLQKELSELADATQSTDTMMTVVAVP